MITSYCRATGAKYYVNTAPVRRLAPKRGFLITEIPYGSGASFSELAPRSLERSSLTPNWPLAAWLPGAGGRRDWEIDMDKAELRYTHGDYYITIGDKIISIDEIAEPKTTTYTGSILFQAVCFLADLTLDWQEPGGEGEETG